MLLILIRNVVAVLFLKNSELLLNKNGKIIGMPCFKCCSAKQEIYQHPSISWLQKIFLVIKCIPNIFFRSFTYSKIFRIFESCCVVKISTTFKRCLTGFAMQILICKTPRASSSNLETNSFWVITNITLTSNRLNQNMLSLALK